MCHLEKAMINYYSYNNPLTRLRTYFAQHAREKMYNVFWQAIKPQKADTIVDIGVSPDQNLAESNFFEKLYPFKENLTVVSIEDCSFLVEKYGLKKYVQNNPKEAFPFSDNYYDILFCNVVLEHVGSRQDQEFFLKECFRIAKNVFITTPNRYFPVEMHTFIPFLHWLPWNVFQKAVQIVKGEKGIFWSDINNLNLLGKRDIEQILSKVKIKSDVEKIYIQYIKTLGFKSNLLIYKCDGNRKIS